MDKTEFHNQLTNESTDIDIKYIDKVIEESIKPLVDVIDSPYDISKVDGVYNLVVVMEELGELTQEISRFIRGKGDKEALMEELADTCLGIKYVQLLCDISDDELKKAINVKTKRQDKRNKDWNSTY